MTLTDLAEFEGGRPVAEVRIDHQLRACTMKVTTIHTQLEVRSGEERPPYWRTAALRLSLSRAGRQRPKTAERFDEGRRSWPIVSATARATRARLRRPRSCLEDAWAFGCRLWRLQRGCGGSIEGWCRGGYAGWTIKGTQSSKFPREIAVSFSFLYLRVCIRWWIQESIRILSAVGGGYNKNCRFAVFATETFVRKLMKWREERWF